MVRVTVGLGPYCEPGNIQVFCSMYTSVILIHGCITLSVLFQIRIFTSLGGSTMRTFRGSLVYRRVGFTFPRNTERNVSVVDLPKKVGPMDPGDSRRAR